MRQMTDISGQKFGRWTVIGFSHADKRNQKYWLSKCSCGTERPVNSAMMKNGLSQSCGCYNRERVAESSRSRIKHGMYKSSEYNIWQLMKDRCSNKNCRAYRRYGGRGIHVCKRWLKFENFYADMGARPTGLQLDRKNNNRGYSKSNCHWTTCKANNSNRRDTLLFTINGKTQCLKDWTRQIGINYHTVYNRLKRGWATKDALTP